MALFGDDPWKMWGTTEIVTVEPSATPPPVSSKQLARINYKRPETWSFFLGARIISGDVQGLDLTVFVDWELTLGVGRSAFDTSPTYISGVPTGDPFERFGWIIPAGVAPSMQDPTKFVTAVDSPVLDETQATPRRTVIDHIVAQDIQARAIVRTSALTARFMIELTTYFSPRTHVRPDWFAGRYDGDEIGGK